MKRIKRFFKRLKLRTYLYFKKIGFAVQVCKGKIKGLDGKKHCSGSYC